MDRLEHELLEKQKDLKARQQVLANLISEIETNSDKDVLLCVVCEESPREVCFDPCGHAATCQEHSNQPFCPICRSSITAKKPFYLA